jgi:hypothetical protein
LETLLTGAILPNPFNHTGWYVLGDLPEIVPNNYILFVLVCNFIGAHSDTSSLLYTLRLVNKQLSLIASHSLLASNSLQISCIGMRSS